MASIRLQGTAEQTQKKKEKINSPGGLQGSPVAGQY